MRDAGDRLRPGDADTGTAARRSALSSGDMRLEEQLQRVELARKRLSAVLDAVPVPLFVTSAEGSVSHVSKASGRVVQADLQTVLGRRLDEAVLLVDADDRPVPSAMLPHHRATEKGMAASRGESFDLFLARPDGARVPVVLQASPILDDARRAVGCVTTLHTLAEHDAVTGLPTAATFVDRATGLLAYLGGQSFGVLRGGRSVTASVGVAVSDGAQQDAHLFTAATEAVAKAVRLGGDRGETVGVSAAKEAMDRLQLAIDLRAAVDRDEIELHFQPEYELSSGELVGFEALARWRHPELGPIAPPVFIGLAEQSGLIAVLGRQLMRRACVEAQSWVGLRTPPSVAVNVSAIQLRPEFVTEVVAILAETGLDPARLVLEITETAAMDDPAQTAPVIEELRQLGVRFSLDDFGTGYSSLIQLTRITFDQLKLDQEFIALIDRPGPHALVAQGVIGLARSLDIPVVAEGVETHAQLAALRQLDCAIGQGYLFSKPIPGELVADFVTRTAAHDGRPLCVPNPR
jgi:EAL domain-containing protein (putative c-di-GMP-specific phosphodiesterase class I)/PAS domain-containing protein